jgi:hypothetical protein
MCVSQSRHIIMSQYAGPSPVTCIDPDTGNRLWTVSDLILPNGRPTDISGRIMVCTGGKTTTVTLEMLDADMGKNSSLTCYIHVLLFINILTKCQQLHSKYL